MKSMSVLAVAASLALVSVACGKRDDNKASETNTTSAPIVTEPAAHDQTHDQNSGSITTGAGATATGDDQMGGSATGTTSTTSAAMKKDGGLAYDFPAGNGLDDQEPTGTATAGKGASDTAGAGAGGAAGAGGGSKAKSGSGSAAGTTGAPGGKNTSTSLGDGTSGQYTGGAGTHGGKATWGTGDPKNVPAPAPKQ